MSFTVRVEPSGHEFRVEPGESVLEAGLRQGITLPYGCRSGSCGSCRGRLVMGTVLYPEGLPEALSPGAAEAGEALFCQARPEGDLVIKVQEAEGVADFPVRNLPCRVERREQLAPDVIRLYLKLPATERLRFLAGQYIDVLLKDGKRRAFSLANAPHDDTFLELHIRKVSGGRFSDYVFSQMREKAMLRIEGPLGTFFLREDSSRPAIFLTGGTGFAPVKGMIEHALAEDTQREMYLYRGARARPDLYLDDLPRTWAGEHANIHYVPVLSDPAPEDDWQGRTGLVHEAVLADFPDLSGCDVYASGPPVMVYAARDAFPAHGLALEHLYSDAFEYAHDTGKD